MQRFKHFLQRHIRQPMDHAPKDGTLILVAYDHDADPYCEEDSNRLTDYGAWAEGLNSLKGKGFAVVYFGGGYSENENEGWGPDTVMPDWWFCAHDEDVVVNPVGWWRLERDIKYTDLP